MNFSTPNQEMTAEARRDLKVLEAVTENERITQRRLASQLGIALGLTNIYLKRLVRKGYIKCVNVQSNRISYLITPQGIAEKARLTYEYLDYSMCLFREVRRHLRATFRPFVEAGYKRIAIFGTGEAAELAYLSLKEVGLEPVALFDGDGAADFLGVPVRDIREHHLISFDLLIVATLENPQPHTNRLVDLGIPIGKQVSLRPALKAGAEFTEAPEGPIQTRTQNG